MGFKHGDIHMMVFFEQQPKEGKPLAMKGLARGLRKLERALQLMNVVGGKVDWNDGVPKIIVNAALAERGGAWSGWVCKRGVYSHPVDVTDPKNITGRYFKVGIADNTAEFVDEVGGDTDLYEYFWVADKIEPEEGPAYYVLNYHTQGDARVMRD